MPDSTWKDPQPIPFDVVQPNGGVPRRPNWRQAPVPPRDPADAYAAPPRSDPTWLEECWVEPNLPALQVYRDPERGLVFGIGPLRYAQRFTLAELGSLYSAALQIESRLGC